MWSGAWNKVHFSYLLSNLCLSSTVREESDCQEVLDQACNWGFPSQACSRGEELPPGQAIPPPPLRTGHGVAQSEQESVTPTWTGYVEGDTPLAVTPEDILLVIVNYVISMNTTSYDGYVILMLTLAHSSDDFTLMYVNWFRVFMHKSGLPLRTFLDVRVRLRDNR